MRLISTFLSTIATLILLLSFTLISQSQTFHSQKANYALASQWSPQKVRKLIFNSAVTPHWLEFSDRFWYDVSTNEGRKYYLVDPHSRKKSALFDNAQMAAKLSRLTLQPYDAQHLPISTIKFIKKDASFQFELSYPKENLVYADDSFKTIEEIGKEQEKRDKDSELEKEKSKTVDKVKTEVKVDIKEVVKDGVKTVEKTTIETTPKEPEPKIKPLNFEYELSNGKLTLIQDYKAPPKRLPWAQTSPDEKTIVFARGFNLFMMDAASYALAQKKEDDSRIKETQLTTDGEDHFSFANRLREEEKKGFQDKEKGRKDYRVRAIGIDWSKDSKKFAIIRSDDRKVGDLWVINSLSNPRPTLETYRYGLPGEENQPQVEMLVFDLATKGRVKIKVDKFKDQTVGIYNDIKTNVEILHENFANNWLSDSSDKVLFERVSRDRHRVDVCSADTATGEVKVLIEERLNTYIDTQPLRMIHATKELVWWSERDGWGHYYLYDSEGKLKGQITSGEYSCQGIEGIDEKSRSLFFNASGREAGEDPYFTHSYRINLDGSNLKSLAPGNAIHAASMKGDSKFFVDNSSRVDLPPVAQLRDNKGDLLIDLEKSDTAALLEAGYKMPELFKVKADDGVTDLYVTMFKPFDFDPQKKYPIITYVYPGPQGEYVTRNFSPSNGSSMLAQLGFIVIEVGNRGGSPQRSKWYHNFGYGNLRDYGLADKKRTIEELAQKFAYIDIERVGIFGHSGGGFMTAASLLVYPDFFKVGVSSSGNHENNIYNRWWSESHQGVKETTDKDGKVHFEYGIDKNSEIAKNLKGHLMLTTGDMDDNVHPGNTLRLADALIRANKRFDLFVFPGQRHGYGDMSDYWFWLRADYFCKYLLGDFSQPVDMLELNRERELKK